MVRLVVSAALILCSAHWSTASADLSAFVASVGFDEKANLDDGMGFGVRWGKSTGLIGGETSIMIARPQRKLVGAEETATAIFYEGRLLLNVPTGTAVQPFVGVGFGMITLTSTDVPANTGDALGAVADAQTNKALSYGGGVRYALGDRLNLRLDLRQYSVFSVTALATGLAAEALQDQLKDQLEDEIGIDLPEGGAGNLIKDKTVQYNELSLGVIFSF
jgi:opacity protein-like surface antigen